MTSTFYKGRSLVQTGKREFKIIPVNTPFRVAYKHDHQTIKLGDNRFYYSCEQTVETCYGEAPTGPIKHLDRFSTSKESITIRVHRIDWRNDKKGDDYPDFIIQEDTKLMYYEFCIRTAANDLLFILRDMKDAQFLYDQINKWIEDDL